MSSQRNMVSETHTARGEPTVTLSSETSARLP